jgi:hypothetical protein
MSEKDKICEAKVKHDGIFDYKEVYRFLYAWLTDFEYFMEERNYTEKVKPEGKEVEIHWIARRKISDYFRFVLKVDWLILGMTNIEVMKDNLKVKANKGVLEIKVTGFLEKDYENRWENTSFLRFLRGVYDRFVIRGRIEDYEDKLCEELDEFVAQAKAFLALEGLKR